ncbi:hypothetical protein [Methylobacterium nodulans]|uniref:Uncharacterized protein n=1 Tax=Methylobacterium nodulans (strain LMG 21967 / CNCM I-2342 / ORS 2060) TaxID=460265 RepID=B8IAL3_METNO|nr:hypothetical protein [Methylobacterium nodulans]ACL61058.1 hypothetical protein Mnod_6252 [Methylobacterium nodulans ORS 2060]
MSDWIWLGVSLVWLGTLIWSGQMRYRHGIWDDAFNQSLPHVQRAMLAYDDERAMQILEDNGIPLAIGDADPLRRDHDRR